MWCRGPAERFVEVRHGSWSLGLPRPWWRTGARCHQAQPTGRGGSGGNRAQHARQRSPSTTAAWLRWCTAWRRLELDCGSRVAGAQREATRHHPQPPVDFLPLVACLAPPLPAISATFHAAAPPTLQISYLPTLFRSVTAACALPRWAVSPRVGHNYIALYGERATQRALKGHARPLKGL